MALVDIAPNSLATSSQVQQIVDLLKGTTGKGAAVALTALNDATAYALAVRNNDAAAKALAVYNADGTLAIDVSGGVPKLRLPSITDFTNAQHAHTSATTGGVTSGGGWRDPVFLSLL